MNMKKDRRASKRISYLCEVQFEGAGLNCLATRMNDLSLTGAFIDSLTCYAPGSRLRLRFRVHEVLIETAAEVRYTMPQIGMGVQFIDLGTDQRNVLESLIEGKPLIPPASTDSHARSDNKQSKWKTPDMLLGDFAVLSMFDVIQIIENNGLSGLLGVSSPSASGEIQFNDGRIADAHSGCTAGVEALKEFLDVTEGSFEFRRSSAHYPSTINAPSNASLVLDLLRVIDEEAAALS